MSDRTEVNPFGTSVELQREHRENARERLASERRLSQPSDRDDAMRGWTAQMGGAPLAEINPAYIEDPVVFSAEELPPPEEMGRAGQRPQQIPPDQLPGDLREDYTNRVFDAQPDLATTGVRESDLERVREVADQRGIAQDRVIGLGEAQAPAASAESTTTTETTTDPSGETTTTPATTRRQRSQ